MVSVGDSISVGNEGATSLSCKVGVAISMFWGQRCFFLTLLQLY